ncbi:MAG: hypothetical protein ABIH18_02675 [Candidatus Omnitrophota bacterium]
MSILDKKFFCVQAKRIIDFLKEESINWCKGKNWLIRLPLLLWFGYIFIKHLFNPQYWGFLGSLDLCIHETGHFIFSPFGDIIGVLGGTLFQCLVPILLMIGFYTSQRDFFAISLCFGWLSVNLFNVSNYIADAQVMQLPLFNPLQDENMKHDWNYLLSKFGILKFDFVIAFFVKLLAILSMLICLVYGGWLLLQMIKYKRFRSKCA